MLTIKNNGSISQDVTINNQEIKLNSPTLKLYLIENDLSQSDRTLSLNSYNLASGKDGRLWGIDRTKLELFYINCRGYSLQRFFETKTPIKELYKILIDVDNQNSNEIHCIGIQKHYIYNIDTKTWTNIADLNKNSNVSSINYDDFFIFYEKNLYSIDKTDRITKRKFDSTTYTWTEIGTLDSAIPTGVDNLSYWT